MPHRELHGDGAPLTQGEERKFLDACGNGDGLEITDERIERELAERPVR
jgi:hypothetical protein